MASLIYIFLISISVGSALATSTDKTTADDLNNRIVNGNRAPKNTYPFMASIQIAIPNDSDSKDFDLYPYCGASIIGENILLTAAHCLPENVIRNRQIYVKVGTVEAVDKSKGQTIAVAEFFIHPDYYNGYNIISKQFSPNDIAILKLEKTLKFTEEIQPISLPAKDYNAEEIDEGKGRILGWGQTQSNNINKSPYLLYADMYAAPKRHCVNVLGNVLPEKTLCLIRDTKTYASTCQGDSGGPFFQTVGNETKLVGLASFGGRNCEIGPKVFTKVSEHLDFIKQYL